VLTRISPQFGILGVEYGSLPQSTSTANSSPANLGKVAMTMDSSHAVS